MRVKVILIFALIPICWALTEQDKHNANGRVNFPDITRICANCLRKLLKNGASLPILGIPPLDPFSFSKYHFKLDDDHLRGDINIQDVMLQDFSNFEINAANAQNVCFGQPDEVKNAMNTTDKEWKMPKKKETFYNTVMLPLILETDYNIDAVLMGFVPINGVGHIDAVLKLYLTTRILDEGTKNTVKITDFKACLNIDEDLKLGISGLQGNEHMSTIITNQLKEVILQGINDEFKEGVSSQLNIIQTLINKVFGNGLLNAIALPILNELCGKDDPVPPEDL